VPESARLRRQGGGRRLSFYRNSVAVFAALFIVLGVALIARTAAAGGGIGYVIGVLFMALGVGRLYLLRR
jgi:hypothetical protein